MGDVTPKCCLCREPAERSGWCTNCRTWPINMTPVRWCDRAHRVDPDGFCWVCKVYVASQLLPGPGEWRDTGRVPRLLPREENARRLGELVQTLEGQTPRQTLVNLAATMESQGPDLGWREAAETLRHRPRPTPRGRIREARAILQAWEGKPWTSQPRTREELARQQETLRGMDGQPVSENAPF